MTPWKYIKNVHSNGMPFLFWLAVSIVAFFGTGALYFIKLILFGGC